MKKSVLLLLVVTGCADGTAGDKGIVRFSQMVDFLETRGFDAPVMRERTVLLRLEHNELAIRRQGFPELELEITQGAADVLPLGFGQYAVRLNDAATYRFAAKDQSGMEIDSLSVRSANAASLRFHPTATVSTRVTNGEDQCLRAEQVALEELRLAPNQTMTITVVPLDAAGSPMVGMLQLLAAQTRGPKLKLDTPLFGEGTVPNSLFFSSNATLGDDITLEVREPGFDPLKLTVPTTPELATTTCN